MTWLNLIATRPILAAIALVAATWLVERAWIITAAAIPAVLYGRYRGQAVTLLESVGFFGVAFVVLCAPVVMLAVL